MPKLGYQKEKCKRGHELTSLTTSPAYRGVGRRCIACNRGTSTAFNLEKRKGIFLTEEEFNQLCHDKFEALKLERGIR